MGLPLTIIRPHPVRYAKEIKTRTTLALQLSIIIPTFNEAQNVKTLINKIEQVLAHYNWEVIFVDDDSSDMTWRIVKDISAKDKRVRCLHRVNRRGLSGACIEGILSSSAPIAIVMDGDLQHDETILPEMIKSIELGRFDLAVGSRYVKGGSPKNGFNKVRMYASQLATFIVHKTTHMKVKDIMSGYFAVRRDRFEEIADKLSPSGFKILFDFVATTKGSLRINEIGYNFRKRDEGFSKFDMRAMWDFIGLLLNKISRGVLPLKFSEYLFVGLLGVFVYLTTLICTAAINITNFQFSQIIASFAAITTTFFVYNFFNYKDAKLKGFFLIRKLLIFYMLSAVGAVSNIGVSVWIFNQCHFWWLSSLAGSVIGAIWNYVFCSRIWPR